MQIEINEAELKEWAVNQIRKRMGDRINTLMREQRFVDYCLEFYRQFDKGLYTLDDIRAIVIFGEMSLAWYYCRKKDVCAAIFYCTLASILEGR